MNVTKLFFATILLLTASCDSSSIKKNIHSQDVREKNIETSQFTNDVHSYANIADIRTTHLHLELDVNFENKKIYGVARHEMSDHSVDVAIFDIKGLEVIKVTTGTDSEENADYVIGEYSEQMGQALKVSINESTKNINIYYQTTEKTEALDWLSPEQTSGKKHPYLYTQGQAILTRSWIPLQDSPSNRITYSAEVKVPEGVIALMSANNPKERNDENVYHFEMRQRIPSYLIALAVGDMVYSPIGENSGVYSERELASACTYEFEDLPKMISAASAIYGQYQWDQYDIVMLPYSFPFGGMENPRLTFANPTLLTGDRSSTSVIAHELAHSWSGNLVTNATWDDFWLNEGFTVYFENRIMEALYGKEEADILATIEYQDLTVAIEDIENGDHPEDTHLKLHLDGRAPDDGMTDIAYVKGAFFLRTLEKTAGREKLDEFLNQYFITHSFQSITTEDFLADLNKNLLDKHNIEFDAEEWIYQPGLPDNHPRIESDRLDKMIALGENVNNGSNADELADKLRGDYTTQEWLTFIRTLKAEVPHKQLKKLNNQFNFSSKANSIVKSDWFKLCARAEFRDVQSDMQKFLVKIGRRWLVEGVYQALMNTKNKKDAQFAKETFEKASPSYHFVTRTTIKEIVQ